MNLNFLLLTQLVYLHHSSCKPNICLLLCKNSRQLEEFQCTKAGRHPATECHQYYQCVDWIFFWQNDLKTCPPNEAFDMLKSECNSAALNTCPSSKATTDDMGVKIVSPPRCSGAGKHPATNCNNYYECEHKSGFLFWSQWEAVLKTCPTGEAFDLKMNDCGAAGSLNCQLALTTSSTTVSLASAGLDDIIDPFNIFHLPSEEGTSSTTSTVSSIDEQTTSTVTPYGNVTLNTPTQQSQDLSVYTTTSDNENAVITTVTASNTNVTTTVTSDTSTVSFISNVTKVVTTVTPDMSTTTSPADTSNVITNVTTVTTSYSNVTTVAPDTTTGTPADSLNVTTNDVTTVTTDTAIGTFTSYPNVTTEGVTTVTPDTSMSTPADSSNVTTNDVTAVTSDTSNNTVSDDLSRSRYSVTTAVTTSVGSTASHEGSNSFKDDIPPPDEDNVSGTNHVSLNTFIALVIALCYIMK